MDAAADVPEAHTGDGRRPPWMILVAATTATSVVRGSGGDGNEDRGALRAKVREKHPTCRAMVALSSSNLGAASNS